MNNAPQEQKETIMKTLAILGFVSIVIVTAFLVIKIVSYLPSAFSSLASLADGVYTAEETELTIMTEETIVNADEPVTIRWSAPVEGGSYVFSYECTNGISLTLTVDGTTEAISCDTEYQLGSATEATLSIASERNRFSDVTYHIGYIPETMDEVLIEDEDLITVINASISPAPTAIATSTDEETMADAGDETDDGVSLDTEAPGTGLYEEDVVADEAAPEPALPASETEYVYEIPTSNPLGYTDLKATFISVGTLDSSDRFTRSATIDNDRRGAIQFEVRNIGTKTSDEWSYEAKLPNRVTYESDDQASLRPNERALITIGFANEDGKTGIATFSVEVDTDEDAYAGNDRFDWAVEIVD